MSISDTKNIDNEQDRKKKCVICDKRTTIGRYFNMVEGEQIKSFEQGSSKGAFILNNGSRISTLKAEVGHIYLKLKDIKPMFAEFDYLYKSEEGNYIQPKLKRIVDDDNKIIWERLL